MDSTLADLCKQLRLSCVYNCVLDYQPDNEDLMQFLTLASQSDVRWDLQSDCLWLEICDARRETRMVSGGHSTGNS